MGQRSGCKQGRSWIGFRVRVACHLDSDSAFTAFLPHATNPCAEYQAKLARLHKAMVNGHAQLLRTNKAALVLRDRLEEKDAETRARRAAEQAAYQSVSAAAADAGGASGPA